MKKTVKILFTLFSLLILPTMIGATTYTATFDSNYTYGKIAQCSAVNDYTAGSGNTALLIGIKEVSGVEVCLWKSEGAGLFKCSDSNMSQFKLEVSGDDGKTYHGIVCRNSGINNSNNSNNTNNSGNHATEEDFTGNLTCGNTSFTFPKSLPNFTNVIFDLLKIATPVIIIITGMLDMFKAVAAQKEDEIKKGQQKLLRRLLAGAVVFLVFFIVEAVIHAFAESNDAENAMDCVECFLLDSDKC